ncbi:thioredoxin-related transmembrane protein 4 isoform X2 [Drosophila teissieri]|uniref:thioredoxin-related transmembrane protein 4 isoform X2 n=1 Tax=Drosophila teissieri TaxID=7243 RepID=UPI001CBA06DE|nr:thioredoxin-related transmembrane protein 4 isoform X2 [Drosophila teissieri]
MTSKLILLLSVFGVIPNAMIPKSPGNIDLCPRGSRKSESSSRIADYGDGWITWIDDGNWTEVLTGEWLLLLCSPLQPKCRDMEAVFYQLATTSMGCLDVELAFGDLSRNFWLRGRFTAITKIAIYHVLDGEFRRASSTQDIYSLRNLLLLREWSELPRVPFWLHPTSIWSRFVTFFLRVAVNLKHSDIFWRNFWLTTLTLEVLFIIASPYLLWRIIRKDTDTDTDTDTVTDMEEDDVTNTALQLASTESDALSMKSYSKEEETTSLVDDVTNTALQLASTESDALSMKSFSKEEETTSLVFLVKFRQMRVKAPN